jgi:hypothetical protein
MLMKIRPKTERFSTKHFREMKKEQTKQQQQQQQHEKKKIRSFVSIESDQQLLMIYHACPL